jgi:hypothetical protein
MTLPIEDALRPALADRGTSFVFPSEICAEFWLRESLLSGWAEALETGRFMGWDSFKELACRSADRAVPADGFFRSIFAARLLADNAASPFLDRLVPRRYAELYAPFVGYLAARLPSLRSLAAAARSAAPARRVEGGSDLLADWLEVHRRYEAFLAATGRYEPSYRPRELAPLPGRYVVLLPELIEDFDEYRGALAASGRVDLVGLGMERPRAGLASTETALGELRAVLREIGALLDAGVEAEDIAMTIPGLDAYRPYLEREAGLLSVPLAIRSGASLASYPGGRLFEALRRAQSSGCSYDSLRDLLLSPAWPWRDPSLNRDLLRAGARLHAVAAWPEEKGMVDVWERSLGRRSDLGAAYLRLRRRLDALASAGSFFALREAYVLFRSEFLSEEGWDPLSDLSLARCVEELSSLARTQAELGVEVENPFGLFMSALAERRYVPPSRSIPGAPSGTAPGAAHRGDSGGVSVYEWRVAAGIAPEHHFVLNASQDALAVPRRRFDFLGEAERRSLGVEDGDGAPDFIAAYALSGARVLFSCPDKGFAGEAAPHGLLGGEEGTEAVPIATAPGRDEYEAEGAWLLGEGPVPTRLHAAQKTGQERAPLAAEAEGRGAFLEPATAALAAERLRRKRDGRLSLDATAIDGYRSCAYRYLYLRLLGAAPEASGIDFIDALFMGEVYHAALALLFERLRGEDGSFEPGRLGEYRGWIGAALDEAFAALSEKRGPFVGVVLEAYRSRLSHYLGRVLEAEAERFPGLEVGQIEEYFEAEYPEVGPGIVVDGRIDRLSYRDGRAVLIDYKKGRLPSRSEVALDEGGALGASQVPCYLKLLEAAGIEAESAWYLSVEGWDESAPGSAACAFGAGEKAYVPTEGRRALLDAFDAAVGESAGGLLAGEFPFPPKDAQDRVCAACEARGICRERYALRFA